jgi:hypothetical protein
MRVLFTKSNSLLSRIIRGITNEPVSHCAIECSGWVMHSNLLGAHVELPQTFESHSEIVYTVEIDFDQAKLMATYAKCDQHMYDFGGLAYLGLRYLIPALPKKNLWQTTGMFLCTEFVNEIVNNTEDSMITPYGLYLKLTKENT